MDTRRQIKREIAHHLDKFEDELFDLKKSQRKALNGLKENINSILDDMDHRYEGELSSLKKSLKKQQAQIDVLTTAIERLQYSSTESRVTPVSQRMSKKFLSRTKSGETLTSDVSAHELTERDLEDLNHFEPKQLQRKASHTSHASATNTPPQMNRAQSRQSLQSPRRQNSFRESSKLERNSMVPRTRSRRSIIRTPSMSSMTLSAEKEMAQLSTIPRQKSYLEPTQKVQPMVIPAGTAGRDGYDGMEGDYSPNNSGIGYQGLFHPTPGIFDGQHIYNMKHDDDRFDTVKNVWNDGHALFACGIQSGVLRWELVMTGDPKTMPVYVGCAIQPFSYPWYEDHNSTWVISNKGDVNHRGKSLGRSPIQFKPNDHIVMELNLEHRTLGLSVNGNPLKTIFQDLETRDKIVYPGVFTGELDGIISIKLISVKVSSPDNVHN